MEIKFPTSWKTLIIKFPPPRDGNGVKCQGCALRFDGYIIRVNTLENGLRTFRRKHMFNKLCHYAHAGIMARARITRIYSLDSRVFLDFCDVSAIKREFLAFPSVIFFKNRLISKQSQYLCTVIFLSKSVRAQLLY